MNVPFDENRRRLTIIILLFLKTIDDVVRCFMNLISYKLRKINLTNIKYATVLVFYLH